MDVFTVLTLIAIVLVILFVLSILSMGKTAANSFRKKRGIDPIEVDLPKSLGESVRQAIEDAGSNHIHDPKVFRKRRKVILVCLLGGIVIFSVGSFFSSNYFYFLFGRNYVLVDKTQNYDFVEGDRAVDKGHLVERGMSNLEVGDCIRVVDYDEFDVHKPIDGRLNKMGAISVIETVMPSNYWSKFYDAGDFRVATESDSCSI